jgi:hypothetical protein
VIGLLYGGEEFYEGRIYEDWGMICISYQVH